MYRRLVISTLCILASACTATYQTQKLSGTETIKLDRQKMIYVAVPADGSYESKRYGGSGQTVAQSVAGAFSNHAANVQVAIQLETPDVAVTSAQKLGAAYVVIPVIAHWEKRATEWSGRPSRMSIRLTILDASTGLQITATSIDGASRVFSWTTTSPESLLNDPLRRYVGTLYQ